MLFGGFRLGAFTQADGQAMRYRHRSSAGPTPPEDSSRVAA
jgi:hypothetical protein